MRIVWEPCIYGGTVHVPCIICGQRAAPVQGRGEQVLLAVVYNDQGRVYGEACRSCVALGVQGIQDCLQERIASLQAQLRDLQELNQGDIQLPTLEEEFKVYLNQDQP